VPLSWPAILTLAIFTWRETWDAFIWPFIVVTQDELRTVPLGLVSRRSTSRRTTR
jgi:multiple sugar transport system permease protein